MVQDLSPGKSACILAVVVGCFAILWPSIFYPMLKGSVFPTKDDGNEYNRQERSPYLRPNAMHPALRERGRAVPQPHSPPPPPRERSPVVPPVIATKKPPIPGIRPPMGGGSHVPSQKGSGPMGILMPLYTVGIVIFFVYTITKLVCKKHDSNTQYIHDPEFHRLVFQNNAKEPKQTADVKSNGTVSPDTSKLGWQENDIRDLEITRLRKRLAETEATMERIVKQMNLVSQSLSNPQDENSIQDEKSSEKPVVKELKEKQLTEKGAEKQAVTENGLSRHDSNEVNGLIQVVGMEMSESCANGQPLKHSPVESTNKSSTFNNIHKEIIADEIILPANVSVNSKILITDASTRNVAEEPSVILESKVTLNVIVNDSNHEATDESNTKEDRLHDADDDDDDAEDAEEDNDEEDEEDISEDNESGSSEQESFEREDVPSTEL